MRTIELDVEVLGKGDLETVDLLARLRLAARRAGVELRLLGAPRRLEELVELIGLGGVLRFEPGRKPEQGKEAVGVEEERELGDSIA